MRNLAKIFSSMALLFGLIFMFSGCDRSKDHVTESKPANLNVDGIWGVTDQNGNKFDITLSKDGTATSTWSTLEHGKWKVVSERKVHIQWKNGANEFIIVDEHGGAQRQVFAPGASTQGKPTETTQIHKK
jgi:uncharacterized lipoprotein NlpE involved in copper resistance